MALPKAFDAYNLRARLLPAIVAGATVIVASAMLVPWNSFGLPQILSGLISAGALAIFADLARRHGKRLENELFAKWGAAPSIVMLRDSDLTFDLETKATYRTFLGTKVKGPGPTPDGAALDAFYARAGNWLRENTRSKSKFNILFEENITYGFRRNLFGLRRPSLVLDALVVAVCVVALVSSISLSPQMPAKLVLLVTFAILHAGYMWFLVTEQSVRDAANQYGRQLLLCCEKLGAVPPKPRSRSKKNTSD